jgi:hypothetical protein
VLPAVLRAGDILKLDNDRPDHLALFFSEQLFSILNGFKYKQLKGLFKEE